MYQAGVRLLAKGRFEAGCHCRVGWGKRMAKSCPHGEESTRQRANAPQQELRHYEPMRLEMLGKTAEQTQGSTDGADEPINGLS